MNQEIDHEELVARIEGGESADSDDVLSSTEVLTRIEYKDIGVYFYRVEELVYRAEFKENTWITGIKISTPQAFYRAGMPKWTPVTLTGFLLPMRYEKGDTIAINFPELLISCEMIDHSLSFVGVNTLKGYKK